MKRILAHQTHKTHPQTNCQTRYPSPSQHKHKAKRKQWTNNLNDLQQSSTQKLHPFPTRRLIGLIRVRVHRVKSIQRKYLKMNRNKRVIRSPYSEVTISMLLPPSSIRSLSIMFQINMLKRSSTTQYGRLIRFEKGLKNVWISVKN